MESHGVEPSLVTVVIPVRNEVRTIDATLEAVVGQTYPALQIVVVDGDSDDGTLDQLAAWCQRDDRIEIVPNPRRTIPPALNLGLSQAKGRWLVRVDAHSHIPTDYVERLVARLESEKWAGVGGRKRAAGGPPSGQAIAAVLNSRWGVGGSTYHYAQLPQETDHIPFGAYDADIARSLGGWDERLVANEDFEFDVRVRKAGGRLFLDPAIVVEWRCRSRIRDLFRQYLRYGRGKADVAWLHPLELSPRHLAPPGLVAATLVAAVATIRGDRRPLAALVGLYGAGVLALSAPIATTLSDVRQRVRVPIVLASMHVSWGLGFWRGIGRVLSNRGRLPALGAADTARWDSPEWHVADS